MKYPIYNNPNSVGKALHAAGFLAIALLLATFYKLGYAQLADQSEAHLQRAEQLDKLLATSENIRNKHQLLRQELDQIELAIATMRGRLPDDLQQEQFEASVRQAATESSFNFEQFTWDSPHSTPSLSSAEVTVNGNGSFASICRFLEEMNQLARITKISQLELKTSSEPGNYPFQVTFVLLYGIGSNEPVDKVDTIGKEGVL